MESLVIQLPAQVPAVRRGCFFSTLMKFLLCSCAWNVSALMTPQKWGRENQSVPPPHPPHTQGPNPQNRGHLSQSHLSQSAAFSAFSHPCFPYFPRFCSVESPRTLVFLGSGEGVLPNVLRIGFESLISKIRPTGFFMTGLK